MPQPKAIICSIKRIYPVIINKNLFIEEMGVMISIFFKAVAILYFKNR